MTRTITFFAALMSVLLMSGCASTGLVHDKNYLRAVSISGSDAKELTLVFFADEENVVAASGDDITAAIKNAEIISGKPILTGYTELVILDDNNDLETLRFLLDDWKVSPSCIVTYSQNGKELLATSSAETLEGSVKQAVEQKKAPESNIITVLGKLLEKDADAVVAELSDSGTTGLHTLRAKHPASGG